MIEESLEIIDSERKIFIAQKSKLTTNHCV